MALEPDFEQALRSSAPVEGLRNLAACLLAKGQERQQVVDLFESARSRLRAEGREADEDAVLDVLDVLLDWCSPHMRLQAAESVSEGNGVPVHTITPPQHK